MLSRNPELHFVFARMGMAEEQGLGLDSLRRKARELSLPPPRFVWADPYLVLTLFLSKTGAAKTLGRNTLGELSKAEKEGWEWLVGAPEPVTAQGYALAMEIPKRTALNRLKHLAELGLIRPIGSGRGVRYEVANQ